MTFINLTYIPLLTLFISFALMVISYFNYSLNRTLNIKNQLHNEKVKTYRELIKLISELISLLDKTNIRAAIKKETAPGCGETMNYVQHLDEKIIEIDQKIIESYLVVPDDMVKLLLDFSKFLHQETPSISTLDEYLNYFEKFDEEIRDLAEKLIEAFRKDIGTRRLNQKLTRL